MAFSLTGRSSLTAVTTVATLQESQPSKTHVNSQGKADPRHVSSISKTVPRNSDALQKTQQSGLPMFLTAGNRSNQPASQPAGWWEQIFQFSSDPWAELLPSNPEIESVTSSVSSTNNDFLLRTTESVQRNRQRNGQKNGQKNEKEIAWNQFDSIPSAVLKKENVKTKKISFPEEEKKTEIRNLDWRAVRRNLRKTETWNDKMYHSGIAAKLAEAISDFDSLL